MKLTAEEFNAIFTFYDKVRWRKGWMEKPCHQGGPRPEWLKLVP